MNIPGVGTVKENMEKATRSMLPTQMTIMPRNQLQIHKEIVLCTLYSTGFSHRIEMECIRSSLHSESGLIRNNHVAYDRRVS